MSAVIAWLIKNEWLCVEETDENGSPLILASRNYWKFHKRREPSGATLASEQGPTTSPDGSPSYPNLSDLTRTGDKKREERLSAPAERTAIEMVQPTKTKASWGAYPRGLHSPLSCTSCAKCQSEWNPGATRRSPWGRECAESRGLLPYVQGTFLSACSAFHGNSPAGL